MSFWTMVKDALESGAVSDLANSYYERKAKTAEDPDDRERASRALAIGGFFDKVKNYRTSKKIEGITDYNTVSLNETYQTKYNSMAEHQEALNQKYNELYLQNESKLSSQESKIANEALTNQYNRFVSMDARVQQQQQLAQNRREALSKRFGREIETRAKEGFLKDVDRMEELDLDPERKKIHKDAIIKRWSNKLEDPIKGEKNFRQLLETRADASKKEERSTADRDTFKLIKEASEFGVELTDQDELLMRADPVEFRNDLAARIGKAKRTEKAGKKSAAEEKDIKSKEDLKSSLDSFFALDDVIHKERGEGFGRFSAGAGIKVKQLAQGETVGRAAETHARARKQLRVKLVRAAGDVGNLNIVEQEAAEQIIPGFWDDKGTADLKRAYLQQLTKAVGSGNENEVKKVVKSFMNNDKIDITKTTVDTTKNITKAAKIRKALTDDRDRLTEDQIRVLEEELKRLGEA